MPGYLIGGNTLAGGGAANAGVRVLGLPFRATGARRDCVSGEMRSYRKSQRCTSLIQNGAVFLLARRSIHAARYQARRIALSPLARQGLWSRNDCSHSSDGCMQYMSACKIHECSTINTYISRATALGHLSPVTTLVFCAPCSNFFGLQVADRILDLGFTAVTAQRIYVSLEILMATLLGCGR